MIDFQAIVMAAGRGSRLTELLTADNFKYQLPVGNLPMIYYPLRTLKNAGFSEVIVVLPSSARARIDDSLADRVGLRIDYEFIAGGEDDLGTLQSLRQIVAKGKIKKDVFVVGCDLVSDFDFTLVANLHRVRNATLTALLAPMSQSLRESPVPGTRGKPKLERDIVGIEPGTRRLLLFNAEADFEETVTMRRKVLKEHPVIDVRSDLIDAHVYLLNKWLLPYLLKDENITTIKGELVPLLTRYQFKNVPKQSEDVVDGEQTETDIFRYAPVKGSDFPGVDLGDDYHLGDAGAHKNPVRCYAYIAEGAFLVRTNTVAGYMEANRQAHQLNKEIFPHIAGGRFDNIAPEKVEFGEKSSARHCVLGQNCRIGAQAKVSDSVLLDGVTVGDGASIQGCIVCGAQEIGTGAVLKNCIVAHKKNVAADAKHANEVLGTFVEI
uniref:Translation initiation factor eIF2B subunit gamma n=1 Tax=Amblyomma sculptum TaxID=1581419 RepID=A0A1E1XS26_AMBSC